MHVAAKDLGTGKEQSMRITGGSALGKDDIERMMKEAESHAEEDKARREEAETRNLADSLVYQTEKFLKDNGDKFTEGEAAEKKAEVEGELNSLKEALKGSNMETIKAGTEKLSEVSQQLGATLYAAEQAAGGGDDQEGEEPHGHGDDVVDAEIVDEQK